MGYGKPPLINEEKWKIYCVRGPLSTKTPGLSKDLGITDSAVLVRFIKLPKSDNIHRVPFMPHQTSAALGDWKDICDEIGINFIHPSRGVETVLSGISSPKLLIRI